MWCVLCHTPVLASAGRSSLREEKNVSKNEKAVFILLAALVIGAVAQHVVDAEAAVLGLSAFEVALVGLAVGSVVKRQLA